MSILMIVVLCIVAVIGILLSIETAIRIEEGRPPYSPFRWENDKYERKIRNED